jgi:hypothetical protein
VPVNEGLSGPESHQLIRTQNVVRYRRLLERVTEESDRQTIFNLLSEEQQKQKDAGDPITGTSFPAWSKSFGV